MIAKIVLYIRMFRSQLRDKNAEHPISWRQKVWRGHRVATAALMLLQDGPPYRAPRWVRR